MKVFCGFTDPIIYPAPHGALNGEASYLSYITKDIYPAGKIVFQTKIDNRQFGLTNDGCFFIEHDWPDVTPVMAQALSKKEIPPIVMVSCSLCYNLDP